MSAADRDRRAWASEHFPGVPYAVVANIGRELTAAGEPVTVDAVRVRLDVGNAA